MKLAIGTCFDYDLSLSQQFSKLQRTSFELVSLGAEERHSGYLNQEGRQRLKFFSEEYQIPIHSLHVPILRSFDLSRADAEKRMAAVCRVALCMASAAELKAPTVILHLNHFPPTPYGQDVEALLDSLEALVESAENMKVRLAAENLWDNTSLGFLEKSLQEFKSEYLGFCYDSSHDQLSERPSYEILEKYADRLFAVHLSDNDGKEDRHWVPFTGIVDWQKISDILRRNRFSGPLLLEVEKQPGQDPDQLLIDASLAAERLQEML
jgi:sugar phosphate isomerase/epimerase